jgi:SLT domain-containing protein
MAIESNMTIEDYMRKASGKYKVIRQDLKPQKETQAASTDFNGILSTFRKPTRQNEQNISKGLTVTDYRQKPVAYSYTRLSQQPSDNSSSTKPDSPNNNTTKSEATETQQTSDGSNSQTTSSTVSERFKRSQYSTLSGLSDSRRICSQTTSKSGSSYRTSDSSQAIEKAVQDAAEQYRLSPNLIKSVIKTESNFDPNAVSPAGAQGLMQLMPGTAKDMGVKNPFDIQQNIDGGTRYLKKMMDMFGGNVKQALSAYNAGPETVKRYNGNVPYSETRQYVDRVMDNTKTIA